MLTLLQFILNQLESFSLTASDISAVIVPINDPRVPNGELRITPGEFAAAAQSVQVVDARRDILFEIQPSAIGSDGQPLIPPPLSFVAGWIDGSFQIVRGAGAVAYPFASSDLTA